MPWFKVDDALAFHIKALAAGNQALGLWVRAGSWSMQQLSDGFVPASMVTALGGGHKDAKALMQAGLWHQVDGGFQFHDWAEYQPTRAEVSAERQASRERVRKHRAKKAGNGERNGDSNGVTNSVSTPAPSRPVPSRDFDKTSRSQSLDDRANDSTDAVSLNVKIAAQNGINDLGAIARAVAEHTGREITIDEAWQVSHSLLQKARTTPSAPMRYVLSAIAKSPFEVQQYIDTAVAS